MSTLMFDLLDSGVRDYIITVWQDSELIWREKLTSYGDACDRRSLLRRNITEKHGVVWSDESHGHVPGVHTNFIIIIQEQERRYPS